MARQQSRRADRDLDGLLLFVAYFRVSTDHQSRSGLGLAAQQQAVSAHVTGAGGRIVAAFEEIESGKRTDRPQLPAALAACRAQRATLVIAKLDRLARNVRFLLDVVEGVGVGGVIFCDLPQIPSGAVGKFLVTLLAAVAELEAGLISQRTKAALAAAKARGVKLGNPKLHNGGAGEMARSSAAVRTGQSTEHASDVVRYIAAARKAGAVSLGQLAEALMARGVKTPMGGDRWTATQVRRVIARMTA